MSKKISLGSAVALALVVAAIAVAITMSVSVKMYNSIISDLPDREKLYSSVSEIDGIVRGSYYGAVDSDMLDSSLFAGYINGLGDADSVYLTSAEYSEYKERASGLVNGIGVNASWSTESERLVLTSVASGSPAHKAGLAKGDAIIKVDEQPVDSENYSQLAALFEGDKLTAVSITYERDGKTGVVSVVRGYESQAITCDASGSVGYIGILDFYANAPSQLKEALELLKQAQVKSIVVDVRGTDEGDVETAALMADMFVPLASSDSGAMARAVNRAGDTVKLFSSDTDEVVLPVIVLTDSGTTGAAEFFAATLKAFGKAQTLGEKTAGKGTLQQLFELSNGGAVLLTVAVLEPYNGVEYNSVGVTPDYEVALEDGQTFTPGVLNPDSDAQVQEAIELLPGD